MAPVEFSVLADKLLLLPGLGVKALARVKNIYAQGVAEVPAPVVSRVLKVAAFGCSTTSFYTWYSLLPLLLQRGRERKSQTI